MSPRFIELIGSPGCGKSTLAHAVSQELEKRGYSVALVGGAAPGTRRLSRILSKLTAQFKGLFHFALCRRSFFAYLNRFPQNQWRRSWQLVGNYLFLLGNTKRLQRQNYDFVIFDQAFVQAQWSVLISGEPKDHPCLDLSQLPVEEILVYLVADPLTIIKRLEQRPGAQSFLEKQGPENWEDLLLRSVTLLTMLYTTFPGKKIQVDPNSSDISGSQLADFLET